MEDITLQAKKHKHNNQKENPLANNYQQFYLYKLERVKILNS